MATLTALLAEIKQKNDELKVLSDKAEPTPEEFAAIKALNDEIKAKMAEAEAARAQEAELKAIRDAAAERARFHATATSSEPGPLGTTEAKTTTSQEGPVYQIPAHGRITSFTGETLREKEIKALSYGHWLLGGVFERPRSLEYCKTHGIEIKAQTEGTNTAGGVLTPQQLVGDTIQLIEQYGVARRLARVRPMSSDSARVPKRTGGLTGYWVGESEAPTESTKNWTDVNLVAKDLGVLAKMSGNLAEDAVIDVANDLASEIALAMAKSEDDALFLGDGTSTYGRIVGVDHKFRLSVTNLGGTWPTNYTYNPSVVIAAGNTFAEVTQANLHSMKAQVAGYRALNPVWMCHRVFYYSVMERIIASAGGATSGDIISMNSDRPTLLGVPVVFVEVLPKADANSQIAAYYGDFRLGVEFGDRRQITIARSTEYYFTTGEVGLRGMERIDMSVHEVGTAHASTAASRVLAPFSALLMAAS